jgi:hypothetical protein
MIYIIFWRIKEKKENINVREYWGVNQKGQSSESGNNMLRKT